MKSGTVSSARMRKANAREGADAAPPPGRSFAGTALAQIAFALGGIGTGTVSLGGRGQLQDWELFNRPNKGSTLALTFCALRAQPLGGQAVSKILERQLLPPFKGACGVPRSTLPGLPRFEEVLFRGAYPFAWVEFQDRDMPVRVTLEAFNPFIPMNVADSSIPGAIFRYRVANPMAVRVSVSLLAAMSNPIDIQPLDTARPVGNTLNVYREEEGLRGIEFIAPDLAWDDVHHGSAALTTPDPDADVQTVLRGYQPGGRDAAQLLWDAFTATGRLDPLMPHRHGTPPDPARLPTTCEPGALCLHADLAPGEERTFTIFIHWHFPYTRVWRRSSSDRGIQVRTYVGNQFADAWDAARYTARHFTRLHDQTRLWLDTLYASSLPTEVLDAVSSQISTLRTQTVMRLADGAIYGNEGCGDQEGCCPGNTLHVWHYEQAMAFLFPSLERTIRRINFGPSLKPDGAMAIGCDAPSGAVNFGAWTFDTAADGQMGNIIQAYRDWQLSGDDAFLRELWPAIRRALEYAWTHPHGWDADRDGVMEGCKHNTYDIKFFGPNAMTTSLYLGALRAAAHMAQYLGEEDTAQAYRVLADRGRARLEKELWNGEYFIQAIEVAPGVQVPAHLQAPEASADPKYQCGEGCLSEQVLGQWMSRVAGLGHILSPDKVRSALASVVRHNFRDPVGEVAHVQRVYALQDEAGLVLCSWPRGNRPPLPFIYCDEVWSGVEYEVAAHLIYEGMLAEGLRLVRAVRARHDGIRRNPWDECECGHHYARAMASWSLVQALSGARYSAVEQSLVFDPKLRLPMKCVFAAGTAWGTARITAKEAAIDVRYGSLSLRRMGLVGCVTTLAAPLLLRCGESLEVGLRQSSVGPSATKRKRN